MIKGDTPSVHLPLFCLVLVIIIVILIRVIQ